MPYQFTCAHCGAEFIQANHSRKYCSTECGYAAKRTKSVPCAGGCGTIMHRSDGSAENPTCRPCRGWSRVARACEFCGREFQATPAQVHNKGRRFCSNDCAIHGGSRLPDDKPGRRSRDIAWPVRFAQCGHCESWFVVRRTGGMTYCSVSCRLANKIKGNRQWEQGLVALLSGTGRARSNLRREVYRVLAERDGSNCGICGDPVDLSFSPGTPPGKKPSIDHVIPRSRGGSDDLDNLALAHMACNSRRKAMPIDVARQRFGYITEHPKQAHEEGLMAHSWERDKYLSDTEGMPE